MISSPTALYLPYGAHELKASYQRNLLLATLLVAGGAGLLVAALLFTGLIEGTPPPMREVPREISATTLGRPPTILPEAPPVSVARTAAPAPTAEGYIPVPIEDDMVLDDDAVIPTRDDLRSWLDRDDEGETAGSGVYVEPTTPEPLPEPGEFVPTEKYPEMIYQVTPAYPPILRKAGIEGTVIVRALVGKEGSVLKAEVARSSGLAAFDDAAVAAAFKNRFSPGIQNGRPVAVWVTYNVAFVLDR